MMHRLRRYDVFRFAQNDVARFTRNDAMFALMCPQAHIISVSVIIGGANIICRRQTSLKKDQVTSDLVFFLSRGYEKDIFVVP